MPAEIDLHTHTTASDGSLTPTELVRLAAKLGLRAVAVTDHDTTDGLEEAFKAESTFGVEVVPGIEISAWSDPWVPHILGYFIDHRSTALRETLLWMVNARNHRNNLLVEKLNRLEIPVTLEQIRANAGGKVIGRPHIAETLFRIGAVGSIAEAFKKYLNPGCPAYVPKERVPLDKAISCILDAGGLPVLAHPMTLTRKGASLGEIIPAWKEMGLAGIEVWYSNHSQKETHTYSRLSERFDLIPTGGSDFHGDAKPDIRLGTGTGNLEVPYHVLANLKQRHIHFPKKSETDRQSQT